MGARGKWVGPAVEAVACSTCAQKKKMFGIFAHVIKKFKNHCWDLLHLASWQAKGPKLTEIVTGDLAHQDWPCGDIGGSQWWCCNLAGNARNSAGNGLLSPCVAGKLPLADQWSSKRPASSGPFWPSLSSYLLLQVILQGGCFQDFFVASFHRQGAEHQRRAVRCSLESGRQVAHSAEDITPPDLKKELTWDSNRRESYHVTCVVDSWIRMGYWMASFFRVPVPEHMECYVTHFCKSFKQVTHGEKKRPTCDLPDSFGMCNMHLLSFIIFVYLKLTQAQFKWMSRTVHYKAWR